MSTCVSLCARSLMFKSRNTFRFSCFVHMRAAVCKSVSSSLSALFCHFKKRSWVYPSSLYSPCINETLPAPAVRFRLPLVLNISRSLSLGRPVLKEGSESKKKRKTSRLRRLNTVTPAPSPNCSCQKSCRLDKAFKST